MIKIEKIKTYGWEESIRGMRNPMNSWDESDSEPFYNGEYSDYKLGKKDIKLATNLCKNGGSHAKFRRMIVVYMDITAPLYFWKELDTYKIGTVRNSCSTMHKIHSRELVTLEDFSWDHLRPDELTQLDETVKLINDNRVLYLDGHRKGDWWQLIQLLPSSYNQKSTFMCNYEVLAHIHKDRLNHKLDEWRKFCKTIECLPYAEELIFPN